MNATPSIDPRRALLLFLAILVLAVPQAALLPLLDRDEPRFAEAAREMIQSGNYVVPTFNGAPRYAKPPLIYWCQAASYAVFGENAFAARLPSLLATAATACLLFTWGVRLGSERIGLGAALAYAFCFQAMQQGRVATADALLIFFMTLTAFAGWQIIRPRAEGKCRPICYGVLVLGFAGGFLAKGPEALLPLIPLLWCARKESAVRARIFGSFLTGLALVLLWAVPALVQSHGDYFKVGIGEDVVHRMAGGDFQGHGTSGIGWYFLGLFYYVLLFWISALPWSPLLVIQRRALFRGWKLDLADTYLTLNAALIFIIFTLMTTKLPHYTLPAFPFLALLFARRWHEVKLGPLPTKLGWIAGIGLTVVAAIGIPIGLACHATPSPAGELVRQAGDVLSPQAQVGMVDFREPTAVWETRRIVTGDLQLVGDADPLTFLKELGPRAIILSTPLWYRLELPSDPAWKIYTARGFNAAKGRFIDLTLVVKP